MDAMKHECLCAKCHAAIQARQAAPHVQLVNSRPLGETIHIPLLVALAQTPIAIAKRGE